MAQSQHDPARLSALESPPHSRQALKSEATIGALLTATTELLLEEGYARVTTMKVAHRAGVSRGALTHHFRSKEHLITAAIDAHLHGVIADLSAFASTLDPVSADSDTIVDFLWEMMSNGLFQMTLEYLPETRVNVDFREEIVPVVRKFHNELENVWAILAQRYDLPAETASVLMNMALCLIRGMIAQSVVRFDRPYFEHMLEEFKAMLKAQIRSYALARSHGR